MGGITRFGLTAATLALLVGSAFMVMASLAKAAAEDTLGWHTEQSPKWGLAVGRPPGWSMLNMRMGDMRLAFERRLDAETSLSCHVHASKDPSFATMKQSALNDYITNKGPPSIEAVTTAMLAAITSSQGAPIYAPKVFSSSLTQVFMYPAYKYEVLQASSTGPNKTKWIRIVYETIYLAGMTYGVNCSAAARDQSTAEALYNRNEVVLQSIMSSLIMFPPADD